MSPRKEEDGEANDSADDDNDEFNSKPRGRRRSKGRKTAKVSRKGWSKQDILEFRCNGGCEGKGKLDGFAEKCPYGCGEVFCCDCSIDWLKDVHQRACLKMDESDRKDDDDDDSELDSNDEADFELPICRQRCITMYFCPKISHKCATDYGGKMGNCSECGLLFCEPCTEQALQAHQLSCSGPGSGSAYHMKVKYKLQHRVCCCGCGVQPPLLGGHTCADTGKKMNEHCCSVDVSDLTSSTNNVCNGCKFVVGLSSIVK